MAEVEHSAFKGLADEELKNKLKLRHRISQGASDANCFVRDGVSNLDAYSGDPLSPGKEPLSPSRVPVSSRRGSRHHDESSGEAGREQRLDSQGSRDAGPPPPAVGSNARAEARLGGERRPAQLEVEQEPVVDSLGSPASPREITEDAAVEDGDGLQYEWQFDILSSLPREKAIALVEHLRSSERERAKATATALRLQRTNINLEQRFEAAVSLLRERDPSCPRLASLLSADSNGHDFSFDGAPAKIGRWGQRLWHCFLGLLAVVVLLMPAAAFFLLASTPVLPPLDSRPRGDAALAPFSDAARPLPSRQAEEDRRLRFELDDARRTIETCQAKLHQPAVPGSGAPDSVGDGHVRETTIREMTLRDMKTVDGDPDTVARLQQENAAMKGQLERLWLDIDLAIQRKQDMVCWKL